MTTPPTFLGRSWPFQFPALNPLWSFQSPMPLNTSMNLPYSIFTNQLPISYVMGQQAAYNGSNNTPFRSNTSQLQARGRSQSLSQPLANVKGKPEKRFQKSKKPNEETMINLVSDDQEPVQLQKVSQEKNTSNTKTNQQNVIPSSPLINIQKQDPKSDTQNKQRHADQSKPAEQHKTPKTKEITKQPIINKKIKTKTQPISTVQKKAPIFSQRIIEKQDTKKETFRVSKRQRQLLQISFLRDSDAIILTGPQFQARLPKFMSVSQESSKWTNSLRTNLLSRQYKEQQQ